MKVIKKIILFLIITLLGSILCSCSIGNKTNTSLPGESVSLAENEQEKKQEMLKDTFTITANGKTFTADFADNSSAEAFKELLVKDDIVVDMHDYGNFEKVGNLGAMLPRNDEQIATEAGDVILYQGNQITIYYGTNSWSFTRLGKIQNATKADLLAAFGVSNVTVKLSINQ